MVITMVIASMTIMQKKRGQWIPLCLFPLITEITKGGELFTRTEILEHCEQTIIHNRHKAGKSNWSMMESRKFQFKELIAFLKSNLNKKASLSIFLTRKDFVNHKRHVTYITTHFEISLNIPPPSPSPISNDTFNNTLAIFL